MNQISSTVVWKTHWQLSVNIWLQLLLPRCAQPVSLVLLYYVDSFYTWHTYFSRKTLLLYQTVHKHFTVPFLLHQLPPWKLDLTLFRNDLSEHGWKGWKWVSVFTLHHPIHELKKMTLNALYIVMTFILFEHTVLKINKQTKLSSPTPYQHCAPVWLM